MIVPSNKIFTPKQEKQSRIISKVRYKLYNALNYNNDSKIFYFKGPIHN